MADDKLKQEREYRQMFDDMLERAKTEKDVYRYMAAHVLDKDMKDVTDAERWRFKQSFFVLFHLRAPDILKNLLEEAREVADLPQVREHLRMRARLDR